MELLNKNEIKTMLTNHFDKAKLVNWHFEEFEEKIIGYLGDHIKLRVQVENYLTSEIKLFVKCMPRNDKWKAKYLEELRFFEKEYVMLSSLFKKLSGDEGNQKWRPKLFFIKENLFVFEDVSQLGYKMPFHRDTMTFEEMKASVKTLARFHASSYIYEEKQSKELSRPYRIWEDYKEYLQEPPHGKDWRDTGRNAVIDYLKIFSKYKSMPNFAMKLELIIPMLYNGAMSLMKPSTEYRNTVVHRDLWTNNIFIREQDGCEPSVLLVDFQTVLYCSPMLDLTSLIYFNTTKSDRKQFVGELINIYYEALRSSLGEFNLDVEEIFPRGSLLKSYNESIMFGMTQAALIVPIVAMDSGRREEIFCDPERSVKANVVSRSNEVIETAQEDVCYRYRVTDLLDDIVETFIISDQSSQ